jgi:hypothetical protein
MSGLDNPGGPDADTPLNAAWRRVVKLARAAGAISTTGNYQADIDADRSLAQSFGFALGYGVEGEDVMQLLDYGIALQADAIVHGTHPLNAFASVASMFLFTGMEFKTSPLEEAPPAGVVLETHETRPTQPAAAVRRRATRAAVPAQPVLPAPLRQLSPLRRLLPAVPRRRALAPDGPRIRRPPDR